MAGGCGESEKGEKNSSPPSARKVSVGAAQEVLTSSVERKIIKRRSLESDLKEWTVKEGEFSSIKLSDLFKAHLTPRLGKSRLGFAETDPSQANIKECEDVIQKRLADPKFVGLFKLDGWEQDEQPAEGETPAEYGLSKAIVPMTTENEIRCVDITIAHAYNEKSKGEVLYKKALDLFMSQDPASDNTWDGGSYSDDHSDVSGDSDLERLRYWIGLGFRHETIGVRIFELIRSSSSDSRPSKVRAVFLAK